MKILIFLLAILLVSCSPKQETVIKYKTFDSCGDLPKKPELRELNEKLYIGNKANIAIFEDNLSKLIHYSNSLEAMVKCYKNQETTEGGEKK